MTSNEKCVSMHMNIFRTPVRFAKRSSLSRSATKVRQRISGAVKSKIKKYKQMMAGEQ